MKNTVTCRFLHGKKKRLYSLRGQVRTSETICKKCSDANDRINYDQIYYNYSFIQAVFSRTSVVTLKNRNQKPVAQSVTIAQGLEPQRKKPVLGPKPFENFETRSETEIFSKLEPDGTDVFKLSYIWFFWVLSVFIFPYTKVSKRNNFLSTTNNKM